MDMGKPIRKGVTPEPIPAPVFVPAPVRTPEPAREPVPVGVRA